MAKGFILISHLIPLESIEAHEAGDDAAMKAFEAAVVPGSIYFADIIPEDRAKTLDFDMAGKIIGKVFARAVAKDGWPERA